jgi:hypothetical protein
MRKSPLSHHPPHSPRRPPLLIYSTTASLTSSVAPASSLILPPSGITLHSVFGQSQTFQILIKYIGKTINNYETKYMQYENIFYDNSNDGYFIL